MFSLIITIISIALSAALALATLYYGGSAFKKVKTTDPGPWYSRFADKGYFNRLHSQRI